MIRTILLLSLAGVTVLSVANGDRAFAASRFDEAAAEYRRALERQPDSPVLHYNLGTALLRAGRHEEARTHLARAAALQDGSVAQPSRYNLGNTELEPSFRAPVSEERNASLLRAIEQYRDALRLDPGDADAKWNLELAQRLLAQQGGGGADDAAAGGGGGGGDDQQATGAPDPAPQPAGAAGTRPQMSPAEAEQVLRSASEVERELQQQRLRRTAAPPPNARDW